MERSLFLKEAKKVALEKKGTLYQEGAKGIYKYFKLYDDDIWLELAEKYKEFFVF